MPQPSDVHVNGYLTSVSVAFLQDPAKFVADIVFPRIGSDKQSDYYPTFTIGSFTRTNMQRRAPGTAGAVATYDISKDPFFCETWNIGHLIDDEERANSDDPFEEDSDTAEFLAQQERIKREVEWGNAFFTTSKWTGGTTLAGAHADIVGGTDFTKWDDIASDPVGDLATQCQSMEGQTGMWPTDLTLTRPGWTALKNHPDILARIQGGATTDKIAIVTRQAVAAIFEIDRVNVAAAVQNSGAEGATDSMGYILGKHALLTYRPATAGKRRASAGYTFFWKGLIGSEDGRRILKFRIDEKHSDKVEIEASWDQKIVSAPLGVFFQNVVA